MAITIKELKKLESFAVLIYHQDQKIKKLERALKRAVAEEVKKAENRQKKV